MEVIPSDLLMLAPNKELSADFMKWGGKNVLVICCKHSRFVYARIASNQTFDSAWEVIQKYGLTFGLPH